MHIYTYIIYIVSTTGTDIPSAKGNALAHAHKTTGLSPHRLPCRGNPGILSHTNMEAKEPVIQSGLFFAS